MKKESIELRRAEVVSKEAEEQREKSFRKKYESKIRHLTYQIETASANGQKCIELYYNELDTHLIKYLETMGYIVVYIKEFNTYIVAFDQQTAKKFKDFNDEYCFKDKGIRFLGLAGFLFMWSCFIFCQTAITIKLFFVPLAILSSIGLIKMIRKGAKCKKIKF